MSSSILVTLPWFWNFDVNKITKTSRNVTCASACLSYIVLYLLQQVNSLFTPQTLVSRRAPPCMAGDRICCHSRLSRPTLFAKAGDVWFFTMAHKHFAVTKISKGNFFFFSDCIFIILLCAALLHQRGNKPLQGQRSFCALRDKTIKLIVLQSVCELFPIDSLSFHHYRRGEGFFFMKKGTDGNSRC